MSELLIAFALICQSNYNAATQKTCVAKLSKCFYSQPLSMTKSEAVEKCLEQK